MNEVQIRLKARPEPLQNFTDFSGMTRRKYVKLTREQKAHYKEYHVEKIKEADTREKKLAAVLGYATIIGGKEGTDLRFQAWEINHSLIVSFISSTLTTKGKMPTVTEIADGTELSRPTVIKHVNEFKKSKFTREQFARFELLKPRILEKLYQLGMDGDVKALKVLLETIDKTNCDPATVINTQNNYIQIKGITLTQEKLSALAPAQLRKIERVLLKEMPAGKTLRRA